MRSQLRVPLRAGATSNRVLIALAALIVVGIAGFAIFSNRDHKQIAKNDPAKVVVPDIKAEDSKKKLPDGWVELGGVARPGTDVQLDKPRTNSKLDELKWPHGYAKPLDPDTNPQVRGVFEALKDRSKPSRFSSFAEAEPFDAAAFQQDPQAYVNVIEPSRVFSTAQPGEGVTFLTPVGSRLHRLTQGESVALQVRAPAGSPITFTSFDLGFFEGSKLSSENVLANEEGIATANFTAGGGTWHDTRILAGGPMTSGQVHFIVDVSLPAGAEEAFLLSAYEAGQETSKDEQGSQTAAAPAAPSYGSEVVPVKSGTAIWAYYWKHATCASSLQLYQRCFAGICLIGIVWLLPSVAYKLVPNKRARKKGAKQRWVIQSRYAFTCGMLVCLTGVSLIGQPPGGYNGGGGGYGGGGGSGGSGATIVGNNPIQSVPAKPLMPGCDAQQSWAPGQTCRGTYDGGQQCTQFSHIQAAPSCSTCTEGGSNYMATTFFGPAMAGRCTCPSGQPTAQSLPNVSKCGTCGGGGVFASTLISSSVANDGFVQYWIPNNRLLNSSFSPGHYSTWDSQLHFYPEGTNGSFGATVTFMDVYAGSTFKLNESQYYSQGVGIDGIYDDYTHNHVKQAKLLDVNGAVTSNLQNGKSFEITLNTGFKEKFEVFNLSPNANELLLAGRLISRTDLDGRQLTIAYKTWTTTEIQQSPDRQWQIQTITDASGATLTPVYATSQVGGRWAITQVTASMGPFTTYTYANGSLTSTNHPNGSQSTFTYGQDSVAQTATAIQTKVFGSRPAKTETRHLTNDYMTLTQSGQALIVNQPSAILRMIVDNDQSLQYMNLAPYDPNLAQNFHKVAGSWAMTEYGNAQFKSFDQWQYASNSGTPSNPYPGVTGNPNANIWGADYTPGNSFFKSEFTGWTKPSGEHVSFTYDENGNVIQAAYTADNTTEKATYNDRRQPTRKQGRNNSVELMTYDANGHLVSHKTGLVYQTGVDVQTSSYAETKYEYYPTGHANAGMLKYVFGPLYNPSQPTLYRTDYEYDAMQHVTKKTESPDAVGGARAVTQMTYTNGLLTTLTNPEGHVTSYANDAAGRVVTTTYPDGSTEQYLYGTGVLSANIVKSKSRLNVVTTINYDGDGRLLQIVSPSAIDANILDGQADDTPITDPNVKTITERSYLPGSSIVVQQKVNGAVTDYFYDYQNRPVETRVYPRVGTSLISKKVYSNNQVLYDEDPYGRRKYYGYRASDGTLIRTITCTVPEQTFADFTAIWNATRVLTPNATYIVNDAIRGEDGRLTQVIDGRGIETRYEYDAQGRETNKRVAYGTSIEARTETVYDLAGQVTEVRTPRYFDSADNNGYQKAREQWTYNGRGKVLSHIVSPGTAEGATESFTYDLHGHEATRTDFGGNVWTRIEDSCCDKQTASVDPLGHGTITNTDSLGRATHTIQVSDVSTHVGSFANPTDAKTLSESTTKYDAAGRPVYQTNWLVARGSVDPANPPIAGVGGVALADGLTTQYFYDNNLTDGVGLDSSTGSSVLKLGTGGSGSFNVTLANALTKLADTQANGGAGITFNSTVPGKATVTINAEDEISFSISDAAGRSVMSGKLNNYRGSGSTAVNTLASWSTQLHDATTNLSGYGTLLVTTSIDALGNATKTWTDAAGRKLRSLDQLDKVTAVTYDAGGNQLIVRDPNNVGADMVYDSLGRNTQRTDTFGDLTKTDYDRSGNAIKQTDAKNKYTVIAFDSRNRRKSTTDRISAGTTFTYLATGQLASLTDAENQTTSYTYDARGSKLTEQYPDHTSGSTVGQAGYGIVTYVYDNAGRVLRKQDQLGDTCTYNYDLAGRVTSRNNRIAANSPSGMIADTDSFTFDRSGRILTAVSGRYTNTVAYAYDPVGRKVSQSLTIASQTYTVGSEFNARNELIKYTYPDGSISNRAYTARGALSELKLDSVVIDTRSYDDGGRMTSEVLGNGITETRAYRADNLLSSISYSNTNIGNLSYSWDANKNKTAETIAGVMSGYGFTSAGTAYDDEDRLTGYQRASGSFNQSWSLTSVGDWNSVTTNGTAVTRTHGPTHELLTSGGQNVTTDVKGNQAVLPASLATSGVQLGLTWDFDNKLKSADTDNNGSADVTFEYDALGRRVARTQGSNAEVYFQADQQTIADYPRGGVASTATYRYVFGSYIDEPVVRKTTGTGGTVLYYHRNQQYSLYATTDSAGTITERYAYTAYGQPTICDSSGASIGSSTISNRYTYTGREWDATVGLYHFRTRWLSGVTGRFFGRDPFTYVDGFSLYGNNFGIRKVDPFGLAGIIVGVGELGPIYMPIPPSPNGADPARQCYTFYHGTTVWVPCPKEPPDWPKGPTYRDGLKELFDGYSALKDMCTSCCNKPSACTEATCRNDSYRLTLALMEVWKDRYNNGPAPPTSREAVGGWMCFHWALFFQDALNRIGSPCFSSIRTGCSHSSDTGRTRRVHEWLEVTIGDGGNGCKVFYDDGFLSSSPGIVHTYPFPPPGEPNYTDPYPPNAIDDDVKFPPPWVR